VDVVGGLGFIGEAIALGGVKRKHERKGAEKETPANVHE
jgi:hypothetical protein